MRKPRRPRVLLALVIAAVLGPAPAMAATPTAPPSGDVPAAAAAAQQAYGVPAPLLDALCYLEGRLSQHGGTPSIDGGYGCMHLVRNDHADTLGRASALSGIPTDRLRTDVAANILGAAAVLRADAVAASPTHAVPATLDGWYPAVAAYSSASTNGVALMYADATYRLLATGFAGRDDRGDAVTLPGRPVHPDRAGAATVPDAKRLPTGCKQDGNVDYPGAVDCVVPAATFDCNQVAAGKPCTYQSANRPTDYAVNYLTIHDVEGTAQDALNVFQNVNSGVSAHYVVDTNGTVYQVIRDKDIAYHAGNFYYNEHAVGIEHAGFDATGYQWYNATEYLASAKLAAYLLTKYRIPLDRAHVTAHGTTPAPTLGTSPNHVDPGQYWLWDYYLGLVHAQGVPYPGGTTPAGVFQAQPSTDQAPLGSGGAETSANNSFLPLYVAPSTQSPRIPGGMDPTDETRNIEADVPYYYLTHTPDQAGSGAEMYQVWFGENDQLPGSQFADASQAWVAVPAGAAVAAHASVVTLGGTSANVYGRPSATSGYVIGATPGGSVYAAPMKVVESGVTWYVLDFNHRQGWVPASEVSSVITS